MSKWSLERVLSGHHEEIRQKLTRAQSVEHPGTKGEASEAVWKDMLKEYLPARYKVDSGHVVDSNGCFSDQIDVLVFDKQYSPFILSFKGKTIVPAESVYAVFEAKQEASLRHVQYAQKKVSSVRRLRRTSLPIPHAGGLYPPKPPVPIYGGLLCVDSTWKEPMGKSLVGALEKEIGAGRLDLGCIASSGYFVFNREFNTYDIHEGDKAATSFLFRLVSELQFSGTVPMIDIQAYAKWLS